MRSIRFQTKKCLLGLALSGLVASGAMASSHREAPFITQMPKVDATDFYMFNSYESGRADYVTLVANYLPLQDAYGGPNYFALDPNAIYEIHVDNDGDAIENLTFQFKFSNTLGNSGNGISLDINGMTVPVPLKAVGAISADSKAAANFSESFTLTAINGDRRTGSATPVVDATSSSTSFSKPLDYIGEKTFGDSAAYENYVSSLTNSGDVYHNVTLSNCPAGAQSGRVFVGQRKESFAVNLGQVFDLVNLNPLAIEDNESNNTLANKNITTLALEIHKDCLAGSGNGVIGAWTTASMPQVSILNPNAQYQQPAVKGGAWTQVSRLSNPLVNEVVIGLPDKDRFNASEPKDDGQFAGYVTNPTLPAILNILFNSNMEFGVADIAPQNFPRNDLVAAFLTGVEGVNQLANVTASEMIRLNTGVPATVMAEQSNLGVAAGDLAGFPNGRRPGDDVVDIALRAVMGVLCHNLPIDLNGDSNIDENDNLLLCASTAADAEAQAPAGSAAFLDGAPQNAAQFSDSFPYLTTPVAGGMN